MTKLNTKTKKEGAKDEKKINGLVKKLNKPLFLSVKLKDKILLTRHLAVMLEAGIPLRESLETLIEQTSSKSLKYILTEAVKDLSDGQVLVYTLNKFPKIFDQFFINIIKIGEASGTLKTALKYLDDQLEKISELKSKVRNALLYPTIVFVGALGIGAYIGFFMLPQLIPLFTSLKVELPITTKIVLWVTTWLNKNWSLFLIFIIVFVIAISVLWRFKPVKIFFHRLMLKPPIIGQLLKQIQLMQFSRILGVLLTSGIKIVPALRITADSMTNLIYQKKVYELADLVERGENMWEELRKHSSLFSKTAANMIGIGEKTGHLSDSLLSLANFTEREVDNVTKNLSTLIEPVVLIIVGLIVGFVALAIITPIYQITQSVSI